MTERGGGARRGAAATDGEMTPMQRESRGGPQLAMGKRGVHVGWFGEEGEWAGHKETITFPI
jgi:hypothetical protein